MKNTLQSLVKYLKIHNIDALLIPSNDEYNNEFTPEYSNRLKFFTGFTGSNGLALIEAGGKLTFFTDSRYTEQAKQELKNSVFEVKDIQNAGLDKWLIKHYKWKALWLCPELHMHNFIEQISKIVEVKMLPIMELDSLWINKLEKPKSNIVEYKVKFSGKSSREKLAAIFKTLKDNAPILITDPNLVCWALNIRGCDIPYTPTALCYALIYNNGSVTIFINNHTLKLSNENKIQSDNILNLSNHLKEICRKKHYLMVDCNKTSAAIVKIINDSMVKIKKISYTEIWQIAMEKTDLEIELSKNVHIEDAVALIKFLYWIKKSFKKDEITEIKAAKKLDEYRKTNKNYKQPSFPTISAFGANSAIVHYNGMNNALIKNGIYLIDSGGQYYGATTDVTRTIILGSASEKQKTEYTLVLKGLITLSTAVFPAKTNAQNLDILARQHLWKNYYDYAHGTSHGVGNYLNVHELPTISKYFSNFPLKPNVVISNEPGIYLNNFYGIRLENLMYVIKLKNNFFGFEQLTAAPFDYDMINFLMLTIEEKNWLNNYNILMRQKVMEKLDLQEKNFLKYHTTLLH
ncbi:Xaa-Pro aminopeptidase [Candidatus Xenohaliotis californiensis]|uniref:Xaa-Pro aminopeptidase n=1 Tax=Candidatus Xenohaliotis californiensis TaxID=84677 RepID=A0ABM9N929_9RICK|nr:Xaa-Pro aminopeptidase [Candidatus Xenohaliotis californiensis]